MISANVLPLLYGLITGWMAPMQLLMSKSNSTALNQVPFSIEAEEMSWVGGIFSLGGVCGTSLFGYCANAIGRRKTLMLAAGFILVSYTLSMLALISSSTLVLCARFVAGIAGAGICVITPMYLGEIAEDHVRGVLSSMFTLLTCIGILVSYIIGSYAGGNDWETYVFLGGSTMTVAAIFVLTSLWLPESPVYCLIKNRPDEAYHSLMRLRGNRKELIERQMTTMSANAKEMASGGTMSFMEMLRDPATRKALIIVNTLLLVQQMSGIAPIVNYTVAIFDASGSSSQISGAMATIIVGALQVIGALVATSLVDRLGRKILLLTSSVGMALVLAPLSYFFYLKEQNDVDTLELISWIPVTSLSLYMVVLAIGLGSLPYVLLSEMFKAEARSAASAIVVALVWFEAFLFLKYFDGVSTAMGIDKCFAFFSLSCLGGAIFIYFYVIETKGKSVESIVLELEGSIPKKATSNK